MPALICSSCQFNMTEHVIDQQVFQKCVRCDLLWIDKHQFNNLTQDIPRSYLPEDLEDLRQECRKRKQEAGDRAIGGGSIHYLQCPECAQTMNRNSFAIVSFVITNVCAQHGVLVSDDAFRSIVDFISRGGEMLCLEKARDDLASKVASLESKIGKVSAQSDLGGNVLLF